MRIAPTEEAHRYFGETKTREKAKRSPKLGIGKCVNLLGYIYKKTHFFQDKFVSENEVRLPDKDGIANNLTKYAKEKANQIVKMPMGNLLKYGKQLFSGSGLFFKNQEDQSTKVS